MTAASTRHPLTRIVATVGPASEDPAILEALIEAGVTTFRLNFSHGSQDGHREVYRNIREIARRLGRPTTIFQDLQGPKLRIGDLDKKADTEIAPGDTLAICTEPVAGTAMRVSTTYEPLARDVRVGDTVLIDDGLIELRVSGIELGTAHGDEVITEVVHGGTLKPNKGINLPGTVVSSPALTPKDLDDLAFGIGLGVDMIALSFVRQPGDVLEARDRIAALGGHQPLIAKIEKPQAVRELEAIVAVSDGLMVARGDLGVELSPDQVPLIQKRLIRLANRAGKPVITATQMLESMIENPRPTRAEASDIANAIFDGTDAVMLSGETAVGAWPVRTVETMAQIARTIEADPGWQHAMEMIAPDEAPEGSSRDAWAVASAAAGLATDVRAKAIAVLTATGTTAKWISQQRPGVPILAFADDPKVAAQLSLWHGIVPVPEASLDASIDLLASHIDDEVARLGHAHGGDRIVTIGSAPRPDGTRTIFVETHTLPTGEARDT